MAHYLVTGGAGFFGSIMKTILLDRGDTVVSIDLEPDGMDRSGYQSYRGDINDGELM